MKWDEYIGEMVRVWDAQHSSVFTEGRVIAASQGPVIWVRYTDSDGAEHNRAHPVSLPIEVMRWVPSDTATPVATETENQ